MPAVWMYMAIAFLTAQYQILMGVKSLREKDFYDAVTHRYPLAATALFIGIFTGIILSPEIRNLISENSLIFTGYTMVALTALSAAIWFTLTRQLYMALVIWNILIVILLINISILLSTALSMN